MTVLELVKWLVAEYAAGNIEMETDILTPDGFDIHPEAVNNQGRMTVYISDER